MVSRHTPVILPFENPCYFDERHASCKVSYAAALAQCSHKGELVIPRRSPQEPHLPAPPSSNPLRVQSRICQHHARVHVPLPRSSASHPRLAPLISLCSHSLRPRRHSSCHLLRSDVSPHTATHTSASITKIQDSSMRSHPRRDRTSVLRVCFSQSPASSFSYCSTVLVLYYTTFALTHLH